MSEKIKNVHLSTNEKKIERWNSPSAWFVISLHNPTILHHEQNDYNI